MRHFRFKELLLVVLFFILVFLCYYFNVSDSDLESADIINSHILKHNIVYNLRVNNVICSYDSENDLYFYSSSDIDELSFSFDSIYDIKYKIYDVTNNTYRILIYNDEYYDIVDLLIDSLPIVQLYSFDIFKLDENFNSEDILLFDNELSSDSSDSSDLVGVQISNMLQNNGRFSFTSVGNLSVRGASSTFFDKKSYKLRLDYEFGFYGVNDDNTWVLDAMCADPSKVRNRLSSDIWNLVNDNQSINNDLNGRFVELFIDDKYMGLYSLKEKVDRSVTSIDDNGLLLKSIGVLDEGLISKLIDNDFNVDEDVFLNFQIKKYNDDTYNSFINKMRNFYSNNCYFSYLDDGFNLDNYLNYKILVSLISGEDNVTSNQYYSMKNDDSKILITPWDMDLTWGSFWNIDSPVLSEFQWNKVSDTDWLHNVVFRDVDLQTLSLLKQRYWELREDVITMDTINGYLDSYKDALVNSGASKRDSDRWYEYDIEYEIEQIREWAQRRIDFLDTYFG